MISGGKGLVLPTVAVALAAALGACSDSTDPDNGSPLQQVTDPGGSEGPDREDQPVGNGPLRHTVTINAEIEEMISPQAFWMGRDRLLVVSTGRDFSSTGARIDEELVADGIAVQVTGTLREFELAAFEREFGIDYDDELFASFENRPVVIAEEIDPLTGEPLTVAGHVGPVFSPVAFRIAGASWRIIVLDPDQPAVREGDFVEVTGSLRQLDPTDLERHTTHDTDQTPYDTYMGDLVLIADKVTSPDHESG